MTNKGCDLKLNKVGKHFSQNKHVMHTLWNKTSVARVTFAILEERRKSVQVILKLLSITNLPPRAEESASQIY